MNRFLSALLLTALPLLAGNIVVDLPGGSGGNFDELTYFNGTPQWVSWDGVYRGTWFNTEDFMPGSTGAVIEEMEYWFYESTNTDPWDTDQFYSEVWNGDNMGPLVQLAQTVVTAYHYAPCYHTFDPGIVVEQNFWAIVNTEMSVGGWPSILGDSSLPGELGHSFFQDYLSWVLWESGEYYIVAHTGGALDATTWGAVKALF